MKERRSTVSRLTGLAEGVAASARRRQRDRAPRVLLYDADGHPATLPPDAPGFDDIVRAVREDIHRAASVAGAGLSAFNLVVRSGSSAGGGKDQIVQAAQAADQARRQLVAAVKQARDGWRQIVADLQEHHQEYHRNDDQRHQTRREQAAWQREIRDEIRQRRRQLRQRQAELRRQQAEAKREQANAQAELRRAQAEARRQRS